MQLNGPILDRVKVAIPPKTYKGYPFNLKLVQSLREIVFPTQVTFFVGENGTGKSTILESIAIRAGFGREGGSKHINFKTSYEETYTGTD